MVQKSQDDAENRKRQPLARGIELLTLMVDSQRETHGVRELAGQMGVSPSTVHRLVTDLERLGLLGRTADGAYRLGLEFLRISWVTAARYPIQEVSIETLEGLTATTGETSFFCTFSEPRRAMKFSISIESPHPLRYSLPMNEWLPLHAGASGLAILAFAPSSIQQEVARSDLRKMTDRTLVDVAPLMNRLAKIREDGYAITHGERIEGAIAIAAPVFGVAGVIGSVGISLPESRFNAATSSELTAVARDAARSLSGYIRGGRDPYSNEPRL